MAVNGNKNVKWNLQCSYQQNLMNKKLRLDVKQDAYKLWWLRLGD